MTISVLGAIPAEYAEILSPAARNFIAALHRAFNPRRKELLKARELRQAELNRGTKIAST